MDKLFKKMIETKNEFYNNMFEDIIHILKDKKGYNREYIFHKIIIKYTFYNFRFWAIVL